MSSPLPPSYRSVVASTSSSSQLSTVAPVVERDEIALIVMPSPAASPSDSPSVPPHPAQTLLAKRMTDLLDDKEEGGLGGRKATLSMALVESVVFVTPPTVSYDADRVEYYADEGKGDRLLGLVWVSLPSRRIIEAIRIRLVVSERLAFPGETDWEDRNLLQKELVYRGEKSNPNDPKSKGFVLEAGVTFFEFSFAIPSSTPAREVSPSGRILCHVQATMLGLDGIFFGGSRLEDKKEAAIFVNQHPDDPAAFQFSYVSEGIDRFLGPRTVTLFSNTFTVASPITVTLAFTALPPNLTIFAISVFIQQTTYIRSSRPPNKTARLVGPKRIIAHQGSKRGFAEEGFAKRARVEGGEAIVLDVEKAGMAGGSWTWSRLSRIPIGDYHRPTTPAGSKTGLRFFSELTVEVYYGLSSDGHDGAVRVVPLFQKNVELASCFCIRDFHDLPDYADLNPHRLPAQGWRWDIGCGCDCTWAVLEAREKAVLQRFQEEADLGIAKRLHHELNSSRLATEADDRPEGEGTKEKDGTRMNGSSKVGEQDEWVWRD